MQSPSQMLDNITHTWFELESGKRWSLRCTMVSDFKPFLISNVLHFSAWINGHRQRIRGVGSHYLKDSIQVLQAILFGEDSQDEGITFWTY